MNQFLFGRPVLPCKPKANGPRRLFVLGAYPSALHVRWKCEGLCKPVQAVAVDNEPEPFWDGADEDEKIAIWKNEVSFRDEWGSVGPCGHLNGPSGGWVSNLLLKPLNVMRSDAWITDCVDTYFESKDAATRMESPDAVRVLAQHKIPCRRHDSHPSEDKIVKIAVQRHLDRLKNELLTAEPRVIVTLGNAALRVFRELLDNSDAFPKKLTADEKYGTALDVTANGRSASLIPLAHPNAPSVYRTEHKKWAENASNHA